MFPKVHPFEMLRAVARSRRGSPGELAADAAWGLAALAYDEPAAVLPACRRLLERQPACGPLWWLSARVLVAGDAAAEAERCGSVLEEDPTPEMIHEAALSGGKRTGPARSGSDDDWGQLRIVRRGGVGELAAADAALVEVSAIGPDAMVVTSSGRALYRAAASAGTPVWIESGVGRLLPGKLWAALADRLGDGAVIGDSSLEVIEGFEGVELIVGPTGGFSPSELDFQIATDGCPEPPELTTRWRDLGM
jgi:hypothetical protein